MLRSAKSGENLSSQFFFLSKNSLNMTVRTPLEKRLKDYELSVADCL